MSKKALIEHLGLSHRAKHEPIDVVEVRVIGKRTAESALQLTYDKWVRDNCTMEMIRALDEIELGWKLFDAGGPTVHQYPYKEIGSRQTGKDRPDPYGWALDVLKTVREFECERMKESPDAWKCFVERFKRGESMRGIEKKVRIRNGMASKNITFILKMYCKKRGWRYK